MGSRLLNGSPQLSVRVTMLPLKFVVMESTVTLGTTLGTPEKILVYVHAVDDYITMYLRICIYTIPTVCIYVTIKCMYI